MVIAYWRMYNEDVLNLMKSCKNILICILYIVELCHDYCMQVLECLNISTAFVFRCNAYEFLKKTGDVQEGVCPTRYDPDKNRGNSYHACINADEHRGEQEEPVSATCNC